MKLKIVALLLPIAVASCSFGMTAGRFRQTTSPRGVETRLTTASVDVTGELLEVRTDGLLVLTSGVRWKTPARRDEARERLLRLVPFTAIQASSFEQMNVGRHVQDGRTPDGEIRERLRLVSRFPYGIPPEVLARLLSAHGQVQIGGILP
jgi:hypothetical protein